MEDHETEERQLRIMLSPSQQLKRWPKVEIDKPCSQISC